VQTENKSKNNKILPIVGVAVLVLVAGAAGIGLRLWQVDRAAKLAAKPTAVQQKTLDAQKLALTGDYTTAHKQLDQALGNDKLSDSERYVLVSQQAATYENQKDYTKALASYQQADSLQPSQNSAECIGRVAEALGNKQLAIDSYKKAITRINPNRPTGADDKDRYQNMIRSLGGTL